MCLYRFDKLGVISIYSTEERKLKKVVASSPRSPVPVVSQDEDLLSDYSISIPDEIQFDNSMYSIPNAQLITTFNPVPPSLTKIVHATKVTIDSKMQNVIILVE